MSFPRRILLCLTILCVLTEPSPLRCLAQEPARQPKDAIGAFLKQLFRGAPKKSESDTDSKSTESSGNAQSSLVPSVDLDPVDDRAIVNRERQSWFERAGRLATEGEFRDSAQLLQQLLETDDDSLILDRQGNWQSLRQEVERLILFEADDALAHAYRSLVSDRAQEQLRQARQQGAFGPLGEVSRRYFATEAGQQAANEIGALMLDGGHIHEAAHWFQRLRDVNAPLTRDPAWRMRAEWVMEQVTEDDPESSPRVDLSPQTEWTSPFGGPTHRGRFTDSDPVLITNWTLPTTERPKVIDEIEQLVDDLDDQQQARIPVAIPLVVDGKVAYRTMRGVSVVDSATGRLLWSTPEGVSIERLLAGESVSRPASEIGVRRVRPVPLNQGRSADDHSLTEPLFRDGVYGFLSSDGERLFVLEDHATLSYEQPGHYRGRRGHDDPFGRDWESNRIVAYDWHDGRIAWSVGGTQNNDEFDPPLAGVLFQGPPVIDGDELFVIGEQRGTETLFVLDRHSGEHRWSHPLSGVSADIGSDLVRRWWPAMPAVDAGVIVCPTTVGWLLAIDRYEHRIRWSHRFVKRREGQKHTRQSMMATHGPLSLRWSPSAPIVAEGRVVFTPPELPDPLYHTEAQLLCLDLMSGEQRWHHVKDQGLYVAGITKGEVLTVSENQVEARDIKTGRKVWQTNISKNSGPPSGRGVITGGDFLLPLQSGELWRLSLEDGTIVQKSTSQRSHEPLGNLLVEHGRLLSLTPLALTSYASRQAIEASLATSPAAAPDSVSQLQAAELLLIDERFEEALKRLDGLSNADLSAAESVTRERLQRKALVALIQADLPASEQFLRRLRDLASSVQQQLEVEQLTATRLKSLGQLIEAFDIYWNRAQARSDLLVETDKGSVRIDLWLAQHIENVWKELAVDQRELLDARIAGTVSALSNDDVAMQEWWSNVLAFHPAGTELNQRLAAHSLQSGQLGDSEVRLLRLMTHAASPSVRGQARDDLIKLLSDQNRQQDVSTLLSRWSHPSSHQPDEPLGNTPSHLTLDLPPDWTSERFGIVQTGSSTNHRQLQLPVERGAGVPSLDRFRLQVHQQLQRLNIDQLNGQPFWEMPLQFQATSQFNQGVIAESMGQVIYLVNRDVLHAVSLSDRKLLWQRSFDLRGANSHLAHHGLSSRRQEMTVASVFRMMNGLRRRSSTTGMLAVANPNYVCFFGRNLITAVDSLTGEPLWTHTGVGPQTKVVGNSRHVFVIPPSPTAPYALDATDGSVVELSSLDELLAGAISVHELGVVTMDVLDGGLFGFGKRVSTLKLVDERSNNTIWSASFRDETRLIRLGEHEMLAIEPGGTVRLVNWAEQSDHPIGQIDAELIENAQNLYAVADRRQVYVTVHQTTENHHWPHRVDSVPANGALVVFDRIEGEIVWDTEGDETNLVIEHLDRLPVLILYARRQPPGVSNQTAQLVQVQMLDKRTGEPMLDETRYISTGAFRDVEFDLAARTIEFKTYRESLRIQPVGDEQAQARDDKLPAEEADPSTDPATE